MRARIATAAGKENAFGSGTNVRQQKIVPSMPELPRVRLSAASQTLYIEEVS
jgi:hypothetical protein